MLARRFISLAIHNVIAGRVTRALRFRLHFKARLLFTKAVAVRTCLRVFLPLLEFVFLSASRSPRATHFWNGPYRVRMGRRLEGKIYFVIMKIADLQRVRSLQPFLGRTGGRMVETRADEFLRVFLQSTLKTKCMIYVFEIVKEKKKPVSLRMNENIPCV